MTDTFQLYLTPTLAKLFKFFIASLNKAFFIIFLLWLSLVCVLATSEW